jgi:hypothetical protein
VRIPRSSAGRGFDYQYDGLNRLTKGIYTSAKSGELLGTTGFDQANTNETGIQYDQNGNILGMAQQGLLSRSGNTLSFGWVDKLRYHYQGNRLLSVHDGAQAASQSSPNPAGDFFDGNRLGSGLEDYAYDNNGSLTLDRNKRINLVEYNQLNLPTRIEFDNGNSYLRYRYDASGRKLQKVVKEGTAAEKTTDYIGGLVYEGNRLQFIPTAEGRILPPALADNGGSWAYEYSYKDHLGNLRLSFRPGRSYSYKATMESSEPAKGNEERMFSNLTDAIRVPNGCVGGGIRLTTTNPMGPMRILKVRRGDIITAKVKGWYSTPASSNGGSGLQLWLQAVPEDNVPGQSETGQNLPSLRVGLTLNLPNGVPSDAPKAMPREKSVPSWLTQGESIAVEPLILLVLQT